LASLILVVNVVNVGELRRKRTLAASRGFLAAARLSCCYIVTYSYSSEEGVLAGHSGQFTPRGYLSTVKHTASAGIELKTQPSHC